MLVLDPSSTCDVCLESYSETKVPHVINCGHAFCLRCLQLLTRQICPLCRRDFEPVHVRRLHTDKGDGRSTTPPPSFDDELDEPSAHARHLQGRVSSIVLEGSTALDVKNTLEDITEWLKGYSPKQFADLEAAYLLLRNYTELQRKAVDRKASLVASQEECEDLRQQLDAAHGNYQEIKRNLYDQKARCEELERLRDEDRQRYKDVEAEYKEKCAELDSTWTGRYEVCLNECKRLAEQVRECERNHLIPLPQSSRYDTGSGGRSAPRPSPQQDDMVVVPEREPRPEPNNSLKIDIGSEANLFHVSPVSPVAPTLAIPDTFRALSDEIPDSEDEGFRSRSAKPIPIKSGLHRAGSSRLKYEADPIARSAPRSLIDVHMASCSSSPSVSNLHAALRDHRGESTSSSQESGLSLTSRYIDCPDMTEEERQVRRRAALQEVLQDPMSKCSSASGAPSSVPRSPAPVIPPPPPPTRSNTVRWASEAARAAERVRAASISSQSHTPVPAPSSPLVGRTPSPTSAYTTTRPPSPRRSPVERMRSQPVRTASTDSLKSMKMPANASGITRTFLVQGAHAQRVS